MKEFHIQAAMALAAAVVTSICIVCSILYSFNFVY